MDKYPGQIRFEYHPYPYTELGMKIAEALEAAGEQGKFWELHNAVITNAPENGEELITLIKTVELDMERFTQDLTSGQYRGMLDSCVREAKDSGVTQVALFINGKEYRKYPGTFEDLCQAIEQEQDLLEASDG